MKPKIFVTRRLPIPARRILEASCDLDLWDEEVHPPYEIILERIRGKEGLLCLLTDRIDAQVMDSAPSLKVISQCAVGYDNIDVDAATERRIRVGNTPDGLTEATADLTFALLMAAARRIGEAVEYVKNGQWKTWGLTSLLGKDVYGATLGVVGFGRIGQAVAKRALGFGMRVLYYSRSKPTNFSDNQNLEHRLLNDLLQESDYVSLHVSLNSESIGMIGKRELELMKPSAILINTARGAIVDQEELYKALKDGTISYAALDVTTPEPLPADDKLLRLPNVIVLPHIGSATVTARNEIVQMAVDNLLAGLEGRELPYPVNEINPLS